MKATRDPATLVEPDEGPDAYRTSMSTTVISVDGRGHSRRVVLEDSTFIAGQADKGTIATQDGSAVYPVDCVTRAGDGQLNHWVPSQWRPVRLEPGDQVDVTVAWESRFGPMQYTATAALAHAVAQVTAGEAFPAAIVTGTRGMVRVVWGGAGADLSQESVRDIVAHVNALIRSGGPIDAEHLPRVAAIEPFAHFYEHRLPHVETVRIPRFGGLEAGPTAGLLPRRLDELGLLDLRFVQRSEDRLIVSVAIAPTDS